MYHLSTHESLKIVMMLQLENKNDYFCYNDYQWLSKSQGMMS